MNWIVISIVIASIVLLAYGAWYLSTQDQRAIARHDKPDQKVVPITWDYNTMSFKEMVAAGNYEMVSPEITPENFRIALGRGKNEIALTLIHFNRELTAEQVIQEMNAQGFNPALIEHLLALGAQHPDLELFNGPPIYFLGAAWQHPDGDVRVARLETSGRHSLSTYWRKGTFLYDDWFAATPK